MRLSLVPCAALLLLPGCALFAGDHGLVFSSEPPGAQILVDGRDSGFVTPCKLDLSSHEDVRLDFELRGHRSETRFLTPDREVYAVLWKEQYVREGVWRFPLWLNLTDFFVPVKWTEKHAPGRVHVRLDRAADVPAAGPRTGK